MANPLSYPSLVEFVGKIRRDLDELMRRRPQVGATVLDELEDVEVKYGHADAPQTGYVLTWDAGVSSRFGGIAKFVAPIPSDMAITTALATHTDDGIFDEVTSFNFQPAFIVNPHQYQLVIVDAVAVTSDSSSGTFLLPDGVTSQDAYYPTPWTLVATNGYTVGATGVGSSRATTALWLHNDTDEDASMNVNIDVQRANADASVEFDGTVTVTARSVFALTTI